MTGRHSIARRLFVGVSLVGVIGTLLLLAFIVHAHEQSFRALGDPYAARHAFHELTEHVLVPVLVLILPMAVASLLAIRRALQPLNDAAVQLQVARAHVRGALIDHSAFPVEAVPFAEALNLLLRQLDDAARDHEAFAADVAHELRTPLAVLALELEALDHPDVPRLRAEVLAMRRLIEQLMLLARVEARSAAHPHLGEVLLGDVAADTVGLMAPGAIAEDKTLALVRVTEGDSVMGHRETVLAALRNLVENALRVTPAGGAVTVLAGPGPVLRVRDGGSGLTPERLAELTRRHRRSDHASREGAGLGLAIVARIMSAHGGTLRTVPDQRELILDFSRA